MGRKKTSDSIEIERKFLVREADLSKAEELKLNILYSVYLDPEVLNEQVGLLTLPDSIVRASHVITSNNENKFFLTHKTGGHKLSRQERSLQITSDDYLELSTEYGVSTLTKKRFTFNYLRNIFELDIFEEDNLILLEIELSNENQLFAVPPFVDIVKEVTGVPSYYGSNIANPVTK